MDSVLVTGGAGFIGANFVRYLLVQKPYLQIVNIDALTYAGSLENLRSLPHPNQHTFIKGDICDSQLLERVFEHHCIDTVVHFAAETHVDRSILGPAPFIHTNIEGTFSLLEIARKMWLQHRSLVKNIRFHHISTDEVFGSLGSDEPAFNEFSPYAPNSPYAASKAASDHLVRSYGHTYGLPFTITNCSNNYGPYQFPEKLIPLMILNALDGIPLPIYGDGGHIRDWLYVEDHCEAILKVLEKGQPGETYLIGGNNQPTNMQLVEALCDILDEKLPDSPHRPYRDLIHLISERPGHDRRYAMDASKLERELGWKARQTLESGLHKTVDWYLSHSDWVEKIRSRPSYQEWIEENYDLRGQGV